MRVLTCLLTALGSVLSASPAVAATITVTFEGVIEEIYGDLPDLAAGDSFVVAVRYDPSLGAFPVSSPIGSHSTTQLSVPPANLTALVGSWEFEAGALRFADSPPEAVGSAIQIDVSDQNEIGADYDSINFYGSTTAFSGPSLPPAGTWAAFGVWLAGIGVLETAQLSDVPLELGSWEDAFFQLSWYHPDVPSDEAPTAFGSIGSMTVLVPEPTTAALLAVGLLAFSTRRNAGRRRS